MTDAGSSTTARALREAFDRAFADPPADAVASTEDVLAVRVGGDAHAIRVSEIVAVHADRELVAIPSDAPSLVGIAGFRNGLLPVFDLAALLGYPRATAPRWIVVTPGAEPVALAFELLEGHARVENSDVSAAEPGGAARPFVRGTVRAGGVARPLVDVASVVEALTRRADEGAPKER